MSTGISSLTSIGNGLSANDGTGDALRDGAGKINANNAAIVTAINNIAASQAGGMISYLLKSDMTADLAHADGVLATVTNDPTDANNAVYRKSGASGSGSWVLTIDRATIVKNDLASTATGKGGSLVGFLQSGTGAVPLTMQAKAQLTKNVEDFGGGVGIDNTAAINAAQAAGVTLLLFGAGNYPVNGASNFYGMTLEGKGYGTTLDCSASTANYALTAQGTLTALPALSANPTYGGNALAFASAPSLVQGSVLVIYNPTDYSFSGFRNYYRAGEWCEVFSVSGSNVKVKGNLYAGYVNTAVNCYALTSAPSGIRRMTILGNPARTGIVLASLLNAPIFDQVNIVAVNSSGIFIDRCFKPKVLNCDSDNLATGAPANPYCISVGNSQHAQVTGGVHFSPWQPITVGGLDATGAVPTRDVTILGAVIRNDPSRGIPAADCHGNCQDIRYVGCTIYGGITFAGAGVSYEDCEIYGNSSSSYGFVEYAGELLGGTYTIKGGSITSYVDPQPNTLGVIDIGGNSTAITASTASACNFIIRPNRVTLNTVSANTQLVKIANRGSAVNINVTIDGFQLVTPSSHYILGMQKVSGTAVSTGIVVDKIQGMPTGMQLGTLGGYVNFPLRMQKQNGMVAGTTTASTSFINAPITLPYIYPREPRVSITLTGSAGANLGLVGGQQTTNLQSYATTATTVRPAFFSGSAMTAGANFELHWATELAEC